MTLELGDVIAQIGGDGGGGGPVPHRYVYDFGHAPIPDDDVIMHEVPDVPEGATLVVTLEWAGPETFEPAVVLNHAPASWTGDKRPPSAIGFAAGYDSEFPEFQPISVVATTSGKEEWGRFAITAVAEGYTATKLTVIVIPAIK